MSYQETLNQADQENSLNNPIIYLPIYFEMMTPSYKKIFKYLWWADTKLDESFFSIPYLAKKCKVSERTVQRFFKRFKNILIFLKSRPFKSYIISIPKEVKYYINKMGGFKIITNFFYHKQRLINMACKDPNSNDLRDSYKQPENKKSEKMSPPPDQKCHPNSYFVFNTYNEEKVLYEKSDLKINLENEEILLKFGLNEREVIKINNNLSGIGIRNGIQDALWYSRIGKKIYNPYAFIYSRAKEHTLKQLHK